MLGFAPASQAKRVTTEPIARLALRSHSLTRATTWQEPWLGAIRKILTDRRPDWATDWIADQLNGERMWGDILTWRAVRDLMASGAIDRPPGPGYTRLLTISGYYEFERERDADLFENEIWQLFEVETQAFHSMQELRGWPQRLVELAASGEIDRDRLIDATLDALWRDFSTPVRTGLTRYHELLQLTDDEVAAREATYRGLLANPQGTVVAPALKALGRLAKAKRLDRESFLKDVAPVFRLSSKAQPKSALTLIGNLTRKPHAPDQSAVEAVSGALAHPAADIQERALDSIEKWRSADASLDLAPLKQTVEQVAPQHRARLEALLGESPSRDETSGDLDQRKAEILTRAADLPADARSLLGLDGLQPALESGALLPPFDPPFGSWNLLGGLERLEPIESVEDLIDLATRLFQSIDRAADIERLVDGLMRLGGETIEHFEERTEVLRNANLSAEWFGESGVASLAYWMPRLIRMLGRWLGVDYAFDTTARLGDTPEYRGIELRHQEYLNRQMAAQFGPVLATPTHQGGWLDPRTFVARMKELSAREIPITRADFIGGLLRLAPDFRNEALQQAADLPAPHGRIVRYALGGDEPPPSTGDLKQSNEWLAAGRARRPHAVLEELTPLALHPEEPDGITPASFELKLAQGRSPAATLYERVVSDWDESRIIVTPSRPAEGDTALRPTAALADMLVRRGVAGFAQRWQYELLGLLWPARRDAGLALACTGLLLRIDNNASSFEPNEHLLLPLLEPGAAISPIGVTALAITLVSKNEPGRAIAIDVLIDGIPDGRITPEPLAAALLDLAHGGWVKWNRVGDALREVARTSRLAERVVAEILDPVIASWSESLPRDGHHLLALQLELLTSLGHALSPAARQVLEGVKGSGKAAKLAKQLRELPTPEAPPAAMIEATCEAAEGRLAAWDVSRRSG